MQTQPRDVTFGATTLSGFLWGNREGFRRYLLWRILSVLVLVPFPWVTQTIVDDVVPARDMQGLMIWVGYLCALILSHVVAMAKAVPEISQEWKRVMVRMRARIFQKLQFMHFGFLDRSQTGRLLSKYAFDTQHIEGAVLPILSAIIPDLVRAVALIALLTVMNPLLMIFIVLSVPLYTWVRWRYFARIEHHNHQVRLARERLTGQANEYISAIKLVRGFGQESEVNTQMERTSDAFADQRRDQMFVNQTMSWVVFAAGTGINAAGIAFGGYFVISGQMSLGTLLALVGAMPTILAPVNQLTQFSLQFFLAKESYRSIKELIDSQYVEKWRGRQMPDPLRGEIIFENVTFSYDETESQPVLRNFDLTIRPGEHVALVGPSGSGKSTAVNLILGLYAPQKGRILIDGLPQDQLDIRAIRRQCAIVMQDNLLLSGNIYDNIRFGCPDADEASVRFAAEQANALDFIEKLENGFKTRVGERGVSLSGGQRQRIAIARALLRDPRILILDEATSALDYESEKLVQEALERLARGRTTITIAHRLSTVRKADTIAVMRDGVIVESGPYEELAARKGGLFQELLAAQA